MFNKKSDSGVSPVVWVIFLVVVILAIFALGPGGTASQNPDTGILWEQNDSTAAVRWVSGQNVDKAASNNYVPIDADRVTVYKRNSTVGTMRGVGETVKMSNLLKDDRIKVTATHENTTQVIWDFPFEENPSERPDIHFMYS